MLRCIRTGIKETRHRLEIGLFLSYWILDLIEFYHFEFVLNGMKKRYYFHVLLMDVLGCFQVSHSILIGSVDLARIYSQCYKIHTSPFNF